LAARRIFFTSSSPQKVCDPVSFKEEYGEDFDPVMKMAKNCTRLQLLVDSMETSCKQGNQDAISLILSVNKEWDRVARYVTPQLKSVELTPSFDDGDCSDTSWTIKVVGVTEK
jgi:hypothetical protein